MPAHGKLLGSAIGTDDYVCGDEIYTLTTRLEVKKATTDDGTNINCALFYEARFSLKQEHKPRGKHVGHLYAYHVDKTKQGDTGDVLWTSEILMVKKDKTELQTIFQELFTANGNVKKHVRGYAKQLQHHTILFVDGFVIEPKYRGKRLAQLALNAFHRLLSAISKGYAYHGTIVLSPAANEDQRSDDSKSDAEVERGLIRSYEKSGYEVWLQGDEEKEGSITAMGRVVDEEHVQVWGREGKDGMMVDPEHRLKRGR